jgi:HEAT repeat protein
VLQRTAAAVYGLPEINKLRSAAAAAGLGRSVAEDFDVDEWLRLFRSANPTVRERAAQGLLQHGAAAPLPVLLEILDELHDHGLGASSERVLRARRDPELLAAMVDRLRSPTQFVREVACGVLGGLGDRSATSYLIASLDDPAMMVRRAAAFGLAFLGDPAGGQALLQRYEGRADDINVRMGLECALQALGVAFERRP